MYGHVAADYQLAINAMYNRYATSTPTDPMATISMFRSQAIVLVLFRCIIVPRADFGVDSTA